MLQNATKPNLHSRSLEHTDFLTRLSQWYDSGSHRLKQLPVEERYLQVRLSNPAIVGWLRHGYTAAKEEETRGKEDGDPTCRPIRPLLKVFFDNLVVMSEFEHMDTVGFDFSLVDDVDRFVDLLSGLAFRAKIFKDYSEIPLQTSELPSNSTREQLATNLSHFVLTTIRYRCLQRQCGQAALQQERLRKRQYGTFWAALLLEDKEKLLLLGQPSTTELIEHFGLKLNSKELDREIRDLLKLQKNDFCNRLLKCKLRRCNEPVRAYYRQLFERLRQKLGLVKSEKKSTARTVRRAKTGSFSSNQTNETDIQTFDRLTQKVMELARFKLESDLEEFADKLSDRANLHFKHREVSFNRLQHTLKPYGVELLLFGSCANGLALERSDVDVALSASVLNFFPYGSIKERTAFALENIHNLLSTKKWISSLKPILTAAIPVLKLEINTDIPMDDCPPLLRQSLEIDEDCQRNVVVQVDVTVDTRGLVEPENSHLGIRSTQLIGEWLAQIDGLYRVLIILKYVLFKRGLNSTYKGGISPYCLLVMIKAYIRHAQLLEPLPSSLLEGFLKFFGEEFDERLSGIDLKAEMSPFYKRELAEHRLQVKDPLNNRVMTRNAYLYNKIREEFQHLKARCIDALKLRIRQNLTSMPEERMVQTLRLKPQQYFSMTSSNYPKNVFCEYDLT